ncbi:MAG: AmmeMemoRadiSam system protein B [Kiritimatiellia bacterium]
MFIRILRKDVCIMCAAVMMMASGNSAASGAIRPPAVAGMFYEADSRQLEKDVRLLLKDAGPSGDSGRLRAAVVPHAGYVYSGSCAASAYALLKTGDYARVIVMAPSHTRGFRGIALPAEGITRYATPMGPIPLDLEACAKLVSQRGFEREPRGPSREHAVEVHLPFLQAALGSFKLIPLVCGSNSEQELDRLAKVLAPLMDDQTLVIASSDFTHFGDDFGYVPFTNSLRERLYEYLDTASAAVASRNRAAFREHCITTGDTICGQKPIDLLLGLMDARTEALKGRVLKKLTSGDVTGDYRHCVSYGAIGFFTAGKTAEKWSPGLSADENRTLMAIAKDSLAWAVKGEKRPFDFSKYAITEKMKSATATFVTLKLMGHLRGCIGSLAPEAPLYQSVHDNAVHAAIHDPRFSPVEPAELSSLDVQISILSPIREIASWKEFRIGEHGIIMAKGRRRAVYLPEVPPEQGWSVEETLTSLSEKAGLPPDAWVSGATFQVFESAKIPEE